MSDSNFKVARHSVVRADTSARFLLSASLAAAAGAAGAQAGDQGRDVLALRLCSQ